MLASLEVNYKTKQEFACARCGKLATKSSLWHTEEGWMCDDCFTEYLNLVKIAGN